MKMQKLKMKSPVPTSFSVLGNSNAGEGQDRHLGQMAFLSPDFEENEKTASYGTCKT